MSSCCLCVRGLSNGRSLPVVVVALSVCGYLWVLCDVGVIVCCVRACVLEN